MGSCRHDRVVPLGRGQLSRCRTCHERKGAMERHGFESYYVLGEGLLGESGSGRPQTLAAAAAAAVPPFRFSRMGPHGLDVQLGEPNRKKIGAAMIGTSSHSQVPAGFTYLGQFIDHDLTFDKTQVMFGAHVTTAQLLQARSPSLDLDSLYGGGPKTPSRPSSTATASTSRWATRTRRATPPCRS